MTKRSRRRKKTSNMKVKKQYYRYWVFGSSGLIYIALSTFLLFYRVPQFISAKDDFSVALGIVIIIAWEIV